MKNQIIKIISAIMLMFSTTSFAAVDGLKKHEIVKENEYSTVILGGGIGALTSGIYLARAGYKPLIIEGDLPGGLITQSYSVENWPGEIQITGNDLVNKIKDQAIKNGCTILSNEVIDVDFSKKPIVITLKDLYSNKTQKIKASSCVIAMGTSSNYLNIKGEKDYWGRGVSNCAVCDGSFYKDKKVAIVGGGDAAVVEANYLSNLAGQVYIIVRKDKMRAKDKEKIKALAQKKNIKIIYNANVTAINGDDKNVTSIDVLDNKNQKKSKIDLDGLFLAIGSTPNSKVFQNKLKLDQAGYIRVFDGLSTSTNGIFAIGDIIDPVYKQAITAAGDGAKAAISCQKYLEENANQNINNSVKLASESTQVFSSKVVEITSLKEFEKELSSSDTPIIVDFYASWCRPCQRIAPLLENGAKILSGKVKILKVNVDKLRDISSKYQIKSMPTIIVFDRDQKQVFSKMGTNSISEVINSLDKIKDKPIDEINSYLKNFDK
ncbi:MAG: Thioredoxin reductase [Candidatus Anoxychlamydiales bacterium]|nr:Thioredoxin reductase [Candidatus Anoxychlamydiales bacterium]